MRDRRFPYEIASILPGELFVSKEPMIVYTVLGSCISACIRDPVVGVGGMNHFMLPDSTRDKDNPASMAARYGAFAMEVLINTLMKMGGRRSHFEAKCAAAWGSVRADGRVLGEWSDVALFRPA